MHSLEGDELCFPNMYDVGDQDAEVMLCWYRHDLPEGVRTQPPPEGFRTMLHVSAEPDEAAAPVTLIGRHGSCVTTATHRAFVDSRLGAYEGFTLEPQPCADTHDYELVVAGAYPGARLLPLLRGQRVATGARASSVLRRDGMSVDPQRRPDRASAGNIAGSTWRFVTAEWVTPAAPDEGLDYDYTESFFAIRQGDRSAVMGPGLYGTTAHTLSLGERRFIVVAGESGSVHHRTLEVFELRPDELTLRLRRGTGTLGDFSTPHSGVIDPTWSLEYGQVHTPLERGAAERGFSEHP